MQLPQCRYGRDDLSQPEYGCLLSHHFIWKQLIESQFEWALVLEDDAVPLNPHWVSLVENLGTSLSGSSLARSPWMVHVGLNAKHFGPIWLRPIQWLTPPAPGSPRVGLVDPQLREVLTTLSYLISRQAAKQLLEKEQSLPVQADDWMARARNWGFPQLLASYQPLFGGSDDFDSQISERSVMVLRSLPFKIYYRLMWPLSQLRKELYRHGLGGITY